MQFCIFRPKVHDVLNFEYTLSLEIQLNYKNLFWKEKLVEWQVCNWENGTCQISVEWILNMLETTHACNFTKWFCGMLLRLCVKFP
jgi:hypothetical protein